jgi:hypothetical protein
MVWCGGERREVEGGKSEVLCLVISRDTFFLRLFLSVGVVVGSVAWRSVIGVEPTRV